MEESNSGLAVSDMFIIAFVAVIFAFGAYTLIKFMRSKN